MADFKNTIIRLIEEDEFFWLVENLSLFWPENADHMQSILDPFWFYEFGNTMYVAVTKDKLVDIIGLVLGVQSQRDNVHGYIVFVATHVDWRRKGVGTLLYSHLFDSLKEKNIISILTAIRPDNIPSLLFHKSMRFNFYKRRNETTIIDGNLAICDYRGKGKHRYVLEKKL